MSERTTAPAFYKLVRARALVARALDASVPVEEARTSALIAVRLIDELGLLHVAGAEEFASRSPPPPPPPPPWWRRYEHDPKRGPRLAPPHPFYIRALCMQCRVMIEVGTAARWEPGYGAICGACLEKGAAT